MAAKDKSIYETFTIRSNDGSKTIDLRGGIVSFSYFENVFSPSFLTIASRTLLSP